MNNHLSNIYSENVNKYSKKLQVGKKHLSYISFVRLILFLLFSWFVYKSITIQFEGYFIGYSILSLIGFLLCLFLSSTIHKKNTFLQQLILINENEIHIQNGQPNFLQNGSTYAPDKGFAVDLNVFGPHSLFHLLNRVGSESGRYRLSSGLQNPLLEMDVVKVFQDCVQELSDKVDFRQSLLAHTLLLEEGETILALQKNIPSDYFILVKNKFWSILAFLWPIAGSMIVFLSFWFDNYQWLLLFGIGGLLLLAFCIKKINLLYAHISKRSLLYNQYAVCFQIILNEKFLHPYLIQKQQEIANAARAFHQLSKLTGLFDLRLSVFGFIINGLFLFDLICARAYLVWNTRYQEAVKKWFHTMGEVEFINSLGTFQFNHATFTFPECKQDSLFIQAKGMGHPLMNQSNAIVNDFSIGNPVSLHIITGSNMSGKSTFLRTVGLNLILAQLGAPVFAKSFSFSPTRILTSFHHIDSLEESTSYFYAELKCLQGIIESLHDDIPSLVLLDEVMRGTNSTDKHDGTALLIEKIIKYPCISLIATHDIEFGVLSQKHQGIIENFCFESELSDSGLIFDFTMRKGVAQSKNATYLMKKMGII